MKVYGELGDTRARLLDSHLSRCSSCQAKLTELTAVHKEFSSLEAPAPNEVFVQGCVKSIVQRKKNAAKAKIPFLLWPVFSAATLLLIFVGYQAFFEQPKERAPLVTAMVPRENSIYADPDLLWDHDLEERLERLSDRLAALNKKARPSEKISSYHRIAKRVSRLTLAIERL